MFGRLVLCFLATLPVVLGITGSSSYTFTLSHTGTPVGSITFVASLVSGNQYAVTSITSGSVVLDSITYVFDASTAPLTTSSDDEGYGTITNTFELSPSFALTSSDIIAISATKSSDSSAAEVYLYLSSTKYYASALPDQYSETITFGAASGNGDPVFRGFDGSVTQVHGVPGEVYNIHSSRSVQVNALFQLINSPSLNSYQFKTTVIASNGSIPVDVVGWSHPGTYMGEMGVLFGGRRIFLAAGALEDGFLTATFDGVSLAVADTKTRWSDMDGLEYSIIRVSPSVMVIQSSTFSFVFVNSDRFLNIHSVDASLFDEKIVEACAATPQQIEGILGRTACPALSMKSASGRLTAKSSELTSPSTVYDHPEKYLVENRNVFSSAYMLNMYDL